MPKHPAWFQSIVDAKARMRALHKPTCKAPDRCRCFPLADWRRSGKIKPKKG